MTIKFNQIQLNSSVKNNLKKFEIKITIPVTIVIQNIDPTV